MYPRTYVEHLSSCIDWHELPLEYGSNDNNYLMDIQYGWLFHETYSSSPQLCHYHVFVLMTEHLHSMFLELNCMRLALGGHVLWHCNQPGKLKEIEESLGAIRVLHVQWSQLMSVLFKCKDQLAGFALEYWLTFVIINILTFSWHKFDVLLVFLDPICPW